MRKYFVIYKANLMSNLQYLTNIVANSVGYFIHIFIFIQVWNYIYDDQTKLIYGYTKNQMIWYVIITEIIYCCVASRAMVREICNDVRSGNVAYNINKPYSYVGYLLFNNLGQSTIRAVVLTIIGFTLGGIYLQSFPEITLTKAIVVLVVFTLAIVINLLLFIFIGLIAFIMEDSNPLYWLYSKMILILGTILPIEFFPEFLQPIITYSPIYVICYGPAKLFIEFDIKSAITIILAQIIYLLISLSLCELIYKKGVKKLNVNGG